MTSTQTKIYLKFTFISFFIFLISTATSQKNDSSTFEFNEYKNCNIVPFKSHENSFPDLPIVGKYVDGPCYAVFTKDSLILFGNGCNLQTAYFSKKDSSIVTLSKLTIPDQIRNIYIEENYAYLATGSGGLRVIDISNPNNPTETDFIYEHDFFEYGKHIEDVFVSKKYAYVAASSEGMRIVDISDPKNIYEISYWDPPAPEHVDDLFIEGNYAFLVCRRSLKIFDISDVYNPVEMSSYSFESRSADAVFVSDSNVYCTFRSQHFKIFRIDSLDNLVEISSYQLNYASSITDIVVKDTIAYILNDGSGLILLNISDYYNPFEIGSIDTYGLAFDLAITDEYVFIADFRDLVTISIEDPFNPLEINSYYTGRFANKVLSKGNYAYLFTQGHGLKILDISNPANPERIGYCDYPGDTNDAFLSGNYIYVADHSIGFLIINISNPYAPFLEGSYNINRTPTGISVKDSLAFIAETNNGLLIFDISDSKDPKKIGECANYSHESSGKITVLGDYAFIADGRKLWVFNITNPENPYNVGSCYIFGGGEDITGIFIIENYLFISGRDGGLKVIDISNPEHPYITGGLQAGELITSMYYLDNHLYTIAGYGQFNIFNLNNPKRPSLINSYSTVPVDWGLSVTEDLIFIASIEYGLYIYENPIVSNIQNEYPYYEKNHKLNQNYPNPFNPETTIEYQLPENSFVLVKVSNILGQEIKTLVNENKPAGNHFIKWDGTDNSGNKVSSGIYVYKIKAGNFIDIKKMVLLK